MLKKISTNVAVALSCLSLWACAANADNPNTSLNTKNPYAHNGKIPLALTVPLTTDNTPRTEIPYMENAENWDEFVAFLIAQAKAQGFDQQVLNQLKTLTFNPRVVRADRNQYERITERNKSTSKDTSKDTTATQPAKPLTPKEASLMRNYLNMHISQAKVNRAVALLKNYKPVLDKISAKYGVPSEVIVGLWGMESNFGRTQGSYNLLDTLASLAYEGRRRVYFTREFFNALRVMEINGFNKDDMKSSWAGAVGQIQFMPTSYLTYGADGNDDGVINIWLSVIDSFASIANYLHKEGWNKDLPWGIKVDMSFADYLGKYKDYIGITKESRTLSEWKKLGIVTSANQPYMVNADKIKANTQFWLVVPVNEPKQAYLVSNNFKVYMHWNRSVYFAYANGTFANLINQTYHNDVSIAPQEAPVNNAKQ
ncbi:lytic transglycosylase domain-containing protein [Psittacicella hinzii]